MEEICHGDGGTVSGSDITCARCVWRPGAGPSRDVLGGICAISTNADLGQNPISSITQTTLVCHSPCLVPAMERTRHRVHFTRGDGHLSGRLALSQRISHRDPDRPTGRWKKKSTFTYTGCPPLSHPLSLQRHYRIPGAPRCSNRFPQTHHPLHNILWPYFTHPRTPPAHQSCQQNQIIESCCGGVLLFNGQPQIYAVG